MQVVEDLNQSVLIHVVEILIEMDDVQLPT